jgi:hypothetical protein
MKEVYVATLVGYYDDGDTQESHYGVFSSPAAFEEYFENRRLDKPIVKSEDENRWSWKWTEQYQFAEDEEPEDVTWIIRLEKKPVIS